MLESTKPSPIPEDMQFQQRSWIAERVGWAVMALFLVAALLGVFYSGVSSDTRAATADGAVVVDYQRFVHRTARSHFTIRVAAPLADNVMVGLSPSFGGSYDIEALIPHPLDNSAGAAGLEFTFARSAAGDLAIELGARARRFGILQLEVAVQGRGSVSITQVIYP